MKAWELMYDINDLDEAVDLMDDVKIIRSDGIEFVCEIENFEVKAYIEYGSPSYLSCNCPKMAPCKHCAALVYYLKSRPDLYLREWNFEEIFDAVDENSLKRFLSEEFKTNIELKNKFLNEFRHNSIDKSYYRNKLSEVFKSGEGRDFKHFEFYDLDLMEPALHDFIFNDISRILSAEKHDFACELLLKIADILNDELMTSYDSWYDLTDRFMEQVNVLSFSVYLESEKLNELYAKTDIIVSLL